MSDARTRELERQAALGDPEARQALLALRSRSGDADLIAVAELRRELRAAVWNVLDKTKKASAANCLPLVGAIGDALAMDEPETGCGYGFRALGSGTWYPGQGAALGVVAVRPAEGDLVVGIAGRRGKRQITPSSLWSGFGPWANTSRPSLLALRASRWVRSVRSNEASLAGSVFGAQTFEVPLETARELVRSSTWAGPRGHALWQGLAPGHLRTPRKKTHERPTLKDQRRLKALCEDLPAEEVRAILVEHCGREDLAELTRPEVKLLVELLEAWSGEGRGPSEEDRARLAGFLERLDMDTLELRRLLWESAGVEHLDDLPSGRVEALVQRLRSRERAHSSGEPEPLPEQPLALPAATDWNHQELDDSELAALIERRDDPAARRRLGAGWSRRVRTSARWAAIPALRQQPVERWRVMVPGKSKVNGIPYASPLGVVVTTNRAAYLLDADTGELRAELPKLKFAEPAAEVLLTAPRPYQVRGVDLWTGEVLYTQKLDYGRFEGEVYVSRHAAHRFADPRQAPVRLEDEVERFCAPGNALGDERGVFVHDTEEWCTRALTPAGQVWTHRRSTPLALNESTVFLAARGSRVTALDRATGQEVLEGRTPHSSLEPGDLWGVEDVLLLPDQHHKALEAWSLEGELLWSCELGPQVRQPHPGWGRVYVASASRVVICLEAPR